MTVEYPEQLQRIMDLAPANWCPFHHFAGNPPRGADAQAGPGLPIIRLSIEMYEGRDLCTEERVRLTQKAPMKPGSWPCAEWSVEFPVRTPVEVITGATRSALISAGFPPPCTVGAQAPIPEQLRQINKISEVWADLISAGFLPVASVRVAVESTGFLPKPNADYERTPDA